MPLISVRTLGSTFRSGGWQQGKLLYRWLWGSFAVLVLGCSALAAWLFMLSGDLPDVTALSRYQHQQPLRIYTQDGVEIGQFGVEHRYFVPIEQIPLLLQKALLAVEDTRFRDHPGIDARGVARALVANLRHSRSQGASTITQQVARNFYLTSRKDYERKLREMLLALKIEQQLTKDQILELYMNQIYLGQSVYGFEAASKTYFGKSMNQLSVAECAMLAGLPQNPSHANPIANFERARKRQLVVLERMRFTQAISAEEYQAAKAEPLQLQRITAPPTYAQHIVEMVRQAVHAQYGEQAYTRGLKVTTALHSTDQQVAHQVLRKGLIDFEKHQPYRGPEAQEDLPSDVAATDQAVTQALAHHNDDDDLRVALVTQASPHALVATLASGEVVVVTANGLKTVQGALAPNATKALKIQRGSVIRVQRTDNQWSVAQWPLAQGALVAIDPQSGHVRALIGGFDFDRNQFNHAEKAWRRAGSSFSPFLYSAALEQGVMPSTYINDAPLTLNSTSTNPGKWEPQNTDGQFDGPLTMRQAFARAKNLVSIRLVQMMGVQAAQQWTQRFGFTADRHPNNLTLALGSGSTTPMQLAGAYAVLANGGYKVNLVLITKVSDTQNQVLFEIGNPKPTAEQRVIPERNAFITNSLLQGAAQSGTAALALASVHRTDLYGQAGAAADTPDTWFAGFQPSLLAVVWMGVDTPRTPDPDKLQGNLSGSVWINFMKQVLQNVPEQRLEPPKGVSQVGGDWIYSERAKGDYVMRLGFDEAPKSSIDPNDSINYPPLTTEYPSAQSSEPLKAQP